MRSGNLTRTTGRLGAALAFALLGACQSIDSLESLLDRDTRSAPPPQAAASAQTPQTTDTGTDTGTGTGTPQVREQRPAGSPPPAGEQTAQPQTAQGQAEQAQTSTGSPIRLQQQANAGAPDATAQAGQNAATTTAPAETQTQSTATAQAGAGETQGPAEGEANAGTTPDPGGGDGSRRVAAGTKSEGFGGDLTRRFNTLFGSSSAVRQPDQLVKASDVAGNWVLEEEDGLRTCAVNLAPPESGNTVQPAQGCSGLAIRAARWSIFGSDLLLSTADNTVVARLRRSGESWIGFTLETGIPLVLSRQATSQG